MTEDASAGNTDEAWEDDILRGLRSLTSDDVPGLEVILIDAVAEWLFSPANPGDGFAEEHAGHMISTLFTALDSARSFFPRQQPTVGDDTAAARVRIVEGAHELAAAGASGVNLTVSRLMEPLVRELRNDAGDPSKQLHGVYVYLLYALAVGTGGDHDPAVMDGLGAGFTAWDAVLRGGYVVPWRRQTGPSDPSAPVQPG